MSGFLPEDTAGKKAASPSGVLPEKTVSVSQITAYIKGMMDSDSVLGEVRVRGEASNYRIYPSGHHYFTLKDKDAVLKCVMFRSDASRVKWKPADGMTLLAGGRISVFPRDGQYQLYCRSLEPDGAGALAEAFERLKAKLEAEGLFAWEHKKKLPAFPLKIALVTSPAGAAVRDMVRILHRRWPLCEIFIIPVRVQGAQAPDEIAEAIGRVNQDKLAELIITGRGGGSLEDLWAFNEEAVARAIFASSIPVVSAVGHEPDVTIADFVADVRASTPSHAAELVTPDGRAVRAQFSLWEARMAEALGMSLQRRRQKFAELSQKRVLTSPVSLVQDKRMTAEFFRQKLGGAMARLLSGRRASFAELGGKLDALSPLKVLGRGYAIARTPDGGVLRSVGEANVSQRLHVRLPDGTLQCVIEDKWED